MSPSVGTDDDISLEDADTDGVIPDAVDDLCIDYFTIRCILYILLCLRVPSSIAWRTIQLPNQYLVLL